MGALDGIRVLEMTRFIAGPYAGRMLGAMGADVTKLEPPAGDQVRGIGPQKEGVSIPFQILNHNKKSLVVDLSTDEGREIVYKMIPDVDIVLESSKSGTTEKLGVSYEKLRQFNEKLIYCSISGFGVGGPYHGKGAVDIAAQAMGGLMWITGYPDNGPVKISQPVADVGAGMYALIGILAALEARHRTGRGQFIDTALIDVPMAWSFWEAGRYFGIGEKPTQLGSSHRNAAPYRAFECSDGVYIVVGVAGQALWERFCPIIEESDLLIDPRFKTNTLRLTNREALEEILVPIMRRRESNEWIKLFEKGSVPAARVNRYEEAVEDPQIKHRDLITSFEHSKIGTIKVPNVPVFLSETKNVEFTQGPVLGEHTLQVLRALGYGDHDIEELIRKKVVVVE